MNQEKDLLRFSFPYEAWDFVDLALSHTSSLRKDAEYTALIKL